VAEGAAEISANMRAWAERRTAASVAMARLWAGKLEGHMKDEQRGGKYWVNRTNNALNGLFGAPRVTTPDEIAVVLGHSVEYGVFLELANDGQNAVLGPTRDAFAPQVLRDFEKVWKGG
jgi:hypothetical protein